MVMSLPGECGFNLQASSLSLGASSIGMPHPYIAFGTAYPSNRLLEARRYPQHVEFLVPQKDKAPGSELPRANSKAYGGRVIALPACCS